MTDGSVNTMSAMSEAGITRGSMSGSVRNVAKGMKDERNTDALGNLFTTKRNTGLVQFLYLSCFGFVFL